MKTLRLIIAVVCLLMLMATMLARENGYSLVKTNDGMAGWVASSVLVSKY